MDDRESSIRGRGNAKLGGHPSDVPPRWPEAPLDWCDLDRTAIASADILVFTTGRTMSVAISRLENAPRKVEVARLMAAVLILIVRLRFATGLPPRPAWGRSPPNPLFFATRKGEVRRVSLRAGCGGFSAGDRTTIAFGVPGEGAATVRATVKLYDVRGRVVRTLVDRVVPPGRYQATWDGDDERGTRAPAGVYFYELVAGGTRLRGKTLLLGN